MNPNRTITCPACQTADPLIRSEANAQLPSLRCGRCGGQWIREEHYYAWIERSDRSSTPSAVEAAGQAQDTPRAKLCPECGRIMRRYAVGHGLDFIIDRCGTCAGIWFDANEWERLTHAGLADRVHFIFSAAWQADILRTRQIHAAAQRLREKIGPDDYDRLTALADWIEQHPHRTELAAYLTDRFRELSPRGPASASAEQ